MPTTNRLTRRGFLGTALGAGATAAGLLGAPLVLKAAIKGSNDRITMGAIGVGGQGRGDLGGFLSFPDVHVVAVCDVVEDHRNQAKAMVDKRNNNTDCKATADFREILARDDIDAVLIATPDHWHALISIEAMKSGKDVYCEKPETLTVRQGRVVTDIARRYGRVFSGGSQRVWGDYNWFHKMVRGGMIGQVKDVFVECGGPSAPCYLPPVETPPGVDWERWLGPAPWRPFHPTLINGGFRPWRDFSGGGMTDWGCHNFGGALFACDLHQTGPVKIIPPARKGDLLTYVFANGIRFHHGGGWTTNLSFVGTEGELPPRNTKTRPAAPDIHIPNYKGSGGIFGDFLHCVRTRQRPFRDIEIAHRTATVCHLGNLAYWLKRPIQWDPEKEQIVGDAEASRWLDRELRQPWRLG